MVQQKLKLLGLKFKGRPGPRVQSCPQEPIEGERKKARSQKKIR